MAKPKRVAREAGQQTAETAYLIGHGVRVAIPDGPDDDPTTIAAEHAALGANPAVQVRKEEARRERAEGRTIPAAELYAELGYTPPSERPKGQRGQKGTPNGRLLVRLPISIHQELAAQAKRDDTTVNQLVLAYVSKGLGHDAGSAEGSA